MKRLVMVWFSLFFAIFLFSVLSCNTTTGPRNKDNNGSVADDDDEQGKDEKVEIDEDEEENDSDDNGDREGVISKIQKGETALNTEVSFDCVITAIIYDKDDDFNNTAILGFYVSELIPAALPYSGIYVFVKDSAEVEAFSIGDHIEVTGTNKDYYGSTQVEVATATVTKLGTADVPEPALIDDPSKISTPFVDAGSEWTPGPDHGEDADKYEDVLIKVSNVKITNSDLGHGAFEITGSLAVDKQIHYYQGSKDEGTEFESVTGILIYAYDAFRIAPRMEEDFIDKDGEDNDDDEENDDDTEPGVIEKIRKGEISENSDVSVDAVVTGIVYDQDARFNKTSIKGFYVSELIPVAVPYTGIYVFVNGTAGVDAYEIGDRVEVSGKYKDYYGSSQIETTSSDITKVGTYDVPEPALIDDPSKVATPFFEDGSVWTPGPDHGDDAEKYESVLIKVSNVEITNSDLGHGAFEVTGSLTVDKQIHYYEGSRDVGTGFASVTGILIYAYDAFRIAPRMEEDFVVKTGE